MRKNLLIVFALILTLTFVACSENIIDNTLGAALEPEYPEYEVFFAEASQEQAVELDILKPVTDGNVVNFEILRDGLILLSSGQDYDVHGILILELSEGLTLARNPHTPGGLAVYNPDNGLIAMIGIGYSENDVVLRLAFNGVGTWTLSGEDDDGTFSFMKSISGEIDGSEASVEYIDEPFMDYYDPQTDNNRPAVDYNRPATNNNEPIPSGGGVASAPPASAPDMETNDAK